MRFTIGRAAIAVVVIATAGGIAGMAYAVIPDSGGVIHSCFKKKGGALHVIDSDATACASNEMSLNWNQTGPAGQKGDKGDTGDTGDSGPPGTSGLEVVNRDIDLSASFPLAPGGTLLTSVACPSGKQGISGGLDNVDTNADSHVFQQGSATLVSTRPTDGGGFGWSFGVQNIGSSDIQSLRLVAVCVNVEA